MKQRADPGSAVFFLILFQFAFVNLAFTTVTARIELIKDVSAPLLSFLTLIFWLARDMEVRGGWRIPDDSFSRIAASALIVWAGFLILSPSTGAALLLWLSMAGYFVLAWSVITFLSSEQRLVSALRTIVIVNALIVGYGLCQRFGIDPLVRSGMIDAWAVERTMVSTHGNQNFLAGFIIVTLPMIVGALVSRGVLISRVLLVPLAAMNIAALLLTEARGAILAVLLTAPIAFALARRRVLAFAGVITLLVIGAGWCVSTEFAPSESIRLTHFRTAIDGALRAPIFGRGLGSFNALMPESRPPDFFGKIPRNEIHAHSEHFEWLFETGVVGLALFWLVLAAFFREGIRVIKLSRASPYLPLAIGAVIGPLNQWIQASVDVETRFTGNAVTLWFAVGFALAMKNIVAPGPPVIETFAPRSARPVLAGGVLLAAGLIAFLGSGMSKIDSSVHGALGQFQAIRAIFPGDASNNYRLALLYQEHGDTDLARDVLKDLQATAPHYLEVHSLLAVLDADSFPLSSAWELGRAAEIEATPRNHFRAAESWEKLGYGSRAAAHRGHLRSMPLDRIRSEDDAAYYGFGVLNEKPRRENPTGR